MVFERILIALDGSAPSAHAAEIGVALARSLGSQVALVHAVDPDLRIGAEGGVSSADLLATAEADGKELLASFRERAMPHASPIEQVLVGKPGAVIVQVATEWSADLIVIGSHGRGGLARAVLGSVAEAVMRHASCPVIVIRAAE